MIEEEERVGQLVDTMYQSISGPAGPRDWSRLASLFHPQCRLIRTVVENGAVGVKIMSMDDFITSTEPFLAVTDFHEVETDREIRIFGNIADVWSAYETRDSPANAQPERRGVNSFQLHLDQSGRWWVMSMIWDNEQRSGFTVRATD